MTFTLPSPDCSLCPRLADFRAANRLAYKDFYNAPVPSFGQLDAELLVVGLAPGLKGANRTGRPFTGDYAGLVLYSSLAKYGFAEGEYDPEKVKPSPSGRGLGEGMHAEMIAPDSPHPGPLPKGEGDTFRLINTRITNSVRCVPQENKPETSEIKQCNAFLKNEIAAMPKVKVILTLGQIAHKAVLMALGYKQSAYAFGHGTKHHLQPATRNLQLLNSYHCSRYNINTGALTQAMFDKVVERARELLRV